MGWAGRCIGVLKFWDMNKFVLFGAVAAAALGLTACNGNAKSADVSAVDGDKEVLYSGVLPSADALGTVYTLKLDFDDDHNYTDGDFALVENSLSVDSVGNVSEVTTSYTEGDFQKLSRSVDGAEVEYIALTPVAKDALGDVSACSNYFIVNADGSLTMVNADLSRSENTELNYTLTVK